MTTRWLLLLLLIVSSQSVDSQSLRKLIRKLQRDVRTLASNQQEILKQLQTVVNRLDKEKPSDCSEIYNSSSCGALDGIYTVYLGSARRPVDVYCDMTTDGGGWTVFQRRQDGSVDFYRNWTDYRTGFGDLSGEFWLGNDNLHLLTSSKRQQLRIDLADFEGNSRYAEYNNFRVDSACVQYKLTSLGTYSGTAGDSFSGLRGQKFSTRDQDNDVWRRSCAVQFKGAWWYSNCHSSNLNGLYLRGNHTSYADGIEWATWKGQYYSLRFTEMKIRPLNI